MKKIITIMFVGWLIISVRKAGAADAPNNTPIDSAPETPFREKLEWPKGGTVSDGVEVAIRAERDFWEPGETPLFNVTVCNRSGNRIRLVSYLGEGLAFTVEDESGEAVEPEALLVEMDVAAFDPKFHSTYLEPGGHCVFPAKVCEYYKNAKLLRYNFRKPGKYIVRAQMTGSRKGSYHGVPFWTGTAVSNPVTIEIGKRVAPVGTQHSGGLQCELYLDKQPIFRGDRIPASVVLRNVSAKPVTVWDPKYSWGYFLTSFEVKTRDQKRKWKFPIRGWEKNYPGTITIPPGGYTIRHVDLTALTHEGGDGAPPWVGILPPWKYTIRAVYECNQSHEEDWVTGVWTGKVVSNPVTLEIHDIKGLSLANQHLRNMGHGQLALDGLILDPDAMRLLPNYFLWRTAWIPKRNRNTLPGIPPIVAITADGRNIAVLNNVDAWSKLLKDSAPAFNKEIAFNVCKAATRILEPDSSILSDGYRIEWAMKTCDLGDVKPELPKIEKCDDGYRIVLWLQFRSGVITRNVFQVNPGWDVTWTKTSYVTRSSRTAKSQKNPRTKTDRRSDRVLQK